MIKTRSFLAPALLLILLATAASAQNVIQLENAKPGNPEWTLLKSSSGQIEGYASANSVNRGESISFYVSSTEPTYSLTIYRLGWYGGAGGRRVHGPVFRNGFKQAAPAVQPSTGLVECNWTDPYTVTVPNSADATDWASGVYLAKLISGTTSSESYVIFTVRDDNRFSNHYFQTSVTTYQAYNNWGGKSLYPHNSTGGVAATKVSFNRPYAGDNGTGRFLWRWEYNMLRFLEREGYDVTYSTNLDTHRRGNLLLNHESFLSVGHDEYWSWEMRANVENARANGIHLGFFAGNSCYWQVRFEPSTIHPSQLDRTMVGYKETYQNDPYFKDSDPSNDKYVTGLWRNAPVNRPEDALLGVKYVYNTVDSDIVIDDASSAPWVFENTSLRQGSILPGLLGYEVDQVGTGTPAGTIILASSPFWNDKINPPRQQYSHMTVYTHPSGAIVFATGSIQWSWGLDEWNTEAHGYRVNAQAQQVTRNVLRKFAGANASRDCQVTLTPESRGVTPQAGSATFSVATNCAWTATTSASWITGISPASGSGSATITYSFATNNGPERTGTITVGGKTHTVRQPSACNTSISPTTASFAPSGGSGSFGITVTSGTCVWTASSNVPWVTFTSQTSGSGNATITYSVGANTGSTRTGKIIVNGVEHTITQSSGCFYTVSPTHLTIGGGGATTTISVNTDATCSWTASANSFPWITITSGTSGRGPGTTTVQIAPNPGPERSGYFSVAGNLVTVAQAAAGTGGPSTTRGDTNGDSRADLIWRFSGTGGSNYIWYMNGPNVTAVPLPSEADANWRIAATGDFNGDGRTDLFWRHATTGANYVWLLNGNTITASGAVTAVPDLAWHVVGAGDVNRDGKADLFWRRTTGEHYLWLMNGMAAPTAVALPTLADSSWQISGLGDVDGNGSTDLVWRRTTGENYLWLLDGASVASMHALPSVAESAWQIVAVADFNGGGMADLLWRHSGSGSTYLWTLNGATVLSQTGLPAVPDLAWTVAATADFNGDGTSDVVWRHSSGSNYLWTMNGGTVASSSGLPGAPVGWNVVGPK